MLPYLATSVAIPISKGKGDVMNCGMFRGAKLLKHSTKIVDIYIRKHREEM